MAAQDIGRNHPCPCGSGKKYKFCCLGKTNTKEFTHAPTSSLNSVIRVFTSNMLMNRVDREARNIAQDFDRRVHGQVVEVDEVYSRVGRILVTGKEFAEEQQDELRIALAVLLSNVLKSFTAAFSLLRTGWRLQPFLCIRNSYEGLSVVLHLFVNWEQLSDYKSGKLKSTAMFESAKKLIPEFGKLYGDLSKQFTHIGQPFRHLQRGSLFAEDEKDLWLCLGHLAFLIWFTYQTAELVFYDAVERRLFWTKDSERPQSGQRGAAYRLNPVPEADELRKRLISALSRKLFQTEKPH